MKVHFKYGVGAFSGTIADATFWPGKTKTGSIMRRWVLPRLTAQNTELGSIAKNLAKVWDTVPAAYKAEGVTYANAWNMANYDPNDPFFQNRGFYSFWVKAMYLYAATDPTHIDLATVTLNDLKTFAGDIGQIKTAITAGFFDNVPGGDLLSEFMWVP